MSGEDVPQVGCARCPISHSLVIASLLRFGYGLLTQLFRELDTSSRAGSTSEIGETFFMTSARNLVLVSAPVGEFDRRFRVAVQGSGGDSVAPAGETGLDRGRQLSGVRRLIQPLLVTLRECGLRSPDRDRD